VKTVEFWCTCKRLWVFRVSLNVRTLKNESEKLRNNSEQSKLIHVAFMTSKRILLLHNKLNLFKCHTILEHWCNYIVTLLSISP
jgi:hypothetical protein